MLERKKELFHKDANTYSCLQLPHFPSRPHVLRSGVGFGLGFGLFGLGVGLRVGLAVGGLRSGVRFGLFV